MKLAGIILSAGESSRMGCDKALLRYQGSTFLNHIISQFVSRLDPVVVVLGHHAEQIRSTLKPSRELRVVINDHYKLGMLSSLQEGIRALPDGVEAAMFTLVDHPTVGAATLDRLISEWERTRAALVVPRLGERRGHPVIASRAILDEMLRLPSDASPKNVVGRHREQTLFVDVQDAGVLRDIDLPSDFEMLESR